MDRLISLQAAIDALGDEPEVWTGKDEYAMGLNNQWHYDRNAIKAVPSAQPETTRILAEALNGSPLLYPCDKLWSCEGWCKDHCKKGQTEPDTECWLKYAETIAAERREE